MFFFITSTHIFAEQLPLKIYSSADGLANDSVNKIMADSRGFLWFCTDEGLSRFDGYSFKNYTQEQGLPHRSIIDFLETKDGDYLVATGGGLAVFNPLGKAFRWNVVDGKLTQISDESPMFITFLTPDSQNDGKISKSILTLSTDSNDTVFVGTNHGLFKFIKSNGDWHFEKIHFDDGESKYRVFNFLFRDSKKNLWIATSSEIYLLGNDGVIRKVNESGGNSVFEDKSGKVWVDSGGDNIGVRIYQYQNSNTTPSLITTYTKKDGLPADGFTNGIVETSEGKILISSDGILCEFIPTVKGKEPKFRSLERDSITSAVNKDGTIWFGTKGKGVARYSPNSFYTFDKTDGLNDARIGGIFGNRKGEIFLTFANQKLIGVSQGKMESVQLLGIPNKNWFDMYSDFESQDGEFWFTSPNGLFRYPKVTNFNSLAKTLPKKVYTTADGLFTNNISRIFEDSRGDVWIVSSTDNEASINRWEKSTDKIHSYLFAEGLPRNSGARSFIEDAEGNIWIGFYAGEIIRYKDGKFRDFAKEGLVSNNYINKFLNDKNGRLWLATSSRGLFRVDNPDAEIPVFTNFSTANGLSSNQTFCLTMDNFGRVYVGTGRGINRIEPDTQRIKIFTQNDGLPGNAIHKCYADVNGDLWFASGSSLIKFTPEAEKPLAPPPIFIDGISVNGKAQRISDLGEKEVKNFELESNERQIQISFFAISFDAGENLRYQYKINDQEWSEPSERRTIDFNLSPGTYNFAVRAITANGVLSENSAAISMIIARPLWQRWWFITLMVFLIASAVFALDRYRVHKTRQIEKALDETRRANVLIRESEIRFRTLADTASDAILTIDADSKIIFVNEAIEKVFGYSPQELIGKPMTMLMPERMRSGHDEGLSRYISTNQKNINWEGVSLPGLHKNGHEIPLEVSFGEFEREGKRYFTGIARDVSERKRAEEELQKAREEKFKELQRVRTRIATDLHDDIGSSLTQIAVLTEVARGQAIHIEEKNLTIPLERIKGVSKELVSVMSDIVWAINPAKDNLPDLLQRMRRFGSDVFSGEGIKFEFYTPDLEENPNLGANIRRELFAIFKEAVNNSAKYSECNEAKVSFQIEDDWINLKIEDNGKGFDTKEVLSENYRPEMGGNGLINIQRRAKDLGGTCRIESEIGEGTRIELEIPLHLPEINA